MNTTHLSEQLFTIAAGLLLIFLVFLFASFKDEEDPLHKRVFTISLSETKNGKVAPKVIMDRIEFKGGKLRIKYLRTKFGYNWIKYRVNKDTTYTDSTDTQVRLLKLEAIVTDENNQTIYLDFTTCEWDLDGVIKITKNDRLKRRYDVAGREKGGKPKKVKK